MRREWATFAAILWAGLGFANSNAILILLATGATWIAVGGRMPPLPRSRRRSAVDPTIIEPEPQDETLRM